MEQRSVLPTFSRMACLIRSDKFLRILHRTLPPHEAARHFVNRDDRRYRNTRVHRFHNSVVVLHVELVTGLDHPERGAHLLGILLTPVPVRMPYALAS